MESSKLYGGCYIVTKRNNLVHNSFSIVIKSQNCSTSPHSAVDTAHMHTYARAPTQHTTTYIRIRTVRECEWMKKKE